MVSSPIDLTSDLPEKLLYIIHLQIQSAGVGQRSSDTVSLTLREWMSLKFTSVRILGCKQQKPLWLT